MMLLLVSQCFRRLYHLTHHDSLILCPMRRFPIDADVASIPVSCEVLVCLALTTAL